MSESNQNSWDSLADEIGAKPVEKADLPASSPASSTAPAPAPVQPEVEYDEPARPASGWDNLLGDFGLEAPAATAEKPVDRPAKSAPQAKVASTPEPVSPEPPANQAPANQAPAAKSEPLPELPRNLFGPEPKPQTPEPVAKEKPEVRKQPTQPSAPAATETPVETAFSDVGEPQDASDTSQESPAAEPPASKWDFKPKAQLSLPDWFPFAGKRSSEGTPPAEPAAAEPTAEEPSEEQTVSDAEEPLAEPTTLSAESGSEEGAEKEEREGRPRRRGRRRRGRRRSAKSDETTTTEEEAAEAVDEGIAARQRKDDLEESPNAEAAEDADDQDDAPHSKHRSVPSWGEAIGVVVDANVAARSERKRTGGRGGSGGRGRRGGRRRGGRRSSSS